MRTFNNKSVIKNLYGIVVAFFGISLLILTWAYHVLAQYTMMPKHRWLHPLDRTTWKIDPNYPNGFCYYYCNIESTLIKQLDLMKDEYDDEYCHIKEKNDEL